MAAARHHNCARLSGMLLEPFRPWPAHVIQLGPVAIRQIPHRHVPFERPAQAGLPDFTSRFRPGELPMSLYLPAAAPFLGTRVNRDWMTHASHEEASGQPRQRLPRAAFLG
jgi:hypothetical protein